MTCLDSGRLCLGQNFSENSKSYCFITWVMSGLNCWDKVPIRYSPQAIPTPLWKTITGQGCNHIHFMLYAPPQKKLLLLIEIYIWLKLSALTF